MDPLIIINPNSSETVTKGIDRAIDPLRAWGRPIRCLTLAEGPRGIESQRQADLTIPHMLTLAARQQDAAGYLIVCFGDPGLHALRDATDKPVLGIQEAAVMTALTLGQRFGIIAILPPSLNKRLLPADLGSSGEPGTAMTSLFCSNAVRAEISDPERSAASITTTPSDRPVIMRLRLGKSFAVARCPKGLSLTINPVSEIAS